MDFLFERDRRKKLTRAGLRPAFFMAKIFFKEAQQEKDTPRKFAYYLLPT